MGRAGTQERARSASWNHAARLWHQQITIHVREETSGRPAGPGARSFSGCEIREAQYAKCGGKQELLAPFELEAGSFPAEDAAFEEGHRQALFGELGRKIFGAIPGSAVEHRRRR